MDQRFDATDRELEYCLGFGKFPPKIFKAFSLGFVNIGQDLVVVVSLGSPTTIASFFIFAHDIRC